MQNMTHAAPKPGDATEPHQLNWPIIVVMAAVHVLAALAFVPALFTWTGLILALVLGWLTLGMGIGVCYHRLLTHRSFRTPKWMEYLLTLCGCLSWEGAPAEWVGMHRLHHKHSDGEHDPHSPKHGFTWAHMLWMLHRRAGDQPGRSAALDLLRDRGMWWIDRLFWLPQVVVTAALLGGGWAWGGPLMGLSWVVWGVAVRTVLVFHITWFVNSASHTWGYRNYPDTGEHSTNLWWVAILSFGEGWHNNHHAQPRSARHGLRWFEVDVSYWTIRLMGLVGLASDIRRPAPDQMPGAAAAG